MFKVERYQKSNEAEWDKFIQMSRIPHFMFERGYMEYHSDRFVDHSLLIRDLKNNLVAVLPANERQKKLYSHQGLTFGGLISRIGTRSTNMLVYFDALLNYCKNKKFIELIYKRAPDIYTLQTNQDDLFALHSSGADLTGRDLTVAIDLKNRQKMSKNRIRRIKKAKKIGLKVEFSSQLDSFWDLLMETLLERHNASPVHKIAEMKYLLSKFPNNIKCYVVKHEQKIIAGSLVYVTPNVAHTQYIASNEFAKDNGAVDVLMSELITNTFSNKKYFSFGTSNDKNSLGLNVGLIKQKEGFGALGYVQDSYEINIMQTRIHQRMISTLIL